MPALLELREASMRDEAELARRHLRFDHGKHDPVVHGDCVRCHSAVARLRVSHSITSVFENGRQRKAAAPPWLTLWATPAERA